MSILVVGSIALDSVQTPYGKVEDAIGGSAIYFSAAASCLSQRVYLVGVAGKDFPRESINFLKKRKVDFTGLQIENGQTFRWGGKYHHSAWLELAGT